MTTDELRARPTGQPHVPAAKRWSVVGIGVLALGFWFVTGLVLSGILLLPDRSGTAQAPAPATNVASGTRLTEKPAASASPDRLRVPRIGVDTTLLELGLTPERELEVPPLSRAGTAGWYRLSPVPGDVGPAVIAGHVDSTKGPAVFYRLRELRRGDSVEVDRADGQRAVFTVDRIEQVRKDQFPTRRVYGPTPRPELRLITCGGAFDAEQGHYVSNVIVYAHLASLEAKTPEEPS